ncbi:unnamed protein product [Periconia digitata]|uniref:Uncharacterized protein n=1 Tax=Periconia digitata TaxID=1303443 RepID=A0A9W4UNJ2_9PLEO|nr:unnamed protein product [Periconia digitata]
MSRLDLWFECYGYYNIARQMVSALVAVEHYNSKRLKGSVWPLDLQEERASIVGCAGSRWWVWGGFLQWWKPSAICTNHTTGWRLTHNTMLMPDIVRVAIGGIVWIIVGPQFPEEFSKAQERLLDIMGCSIIRDSLIIHVYSVLSCPRWPVLLHHDPYLLQLRAKCVATDEQ